MCAGSQKTTSRRASARRARMLPSVIGGPGGEGMATLMWRPRRWGHRGLQSRARHAFERLRARWYGYCLKGLTYANAGQFSLTDYDDYVAATSRRAASVGEESIMADRGTFLGRHHPTVRRRAGAHSLCMENASNCSAVPRLAAGASASAQAQVSVKKPMNNTAAANPA